MQDVDVRELHKVMNNYIHPNYTPGLGTAPWEQFFLQTKCVVTLRRNLHGLISTVQKHHVDLLFC